MRNRRIKNCFVIVIFFIFMISAYNPLTSSIERKIVWKNNSNFYYSYNQLSSLLDYLQLRYPEIFLYSSLGKTYEGRNIWLVKISDNVNTEEKEPAILYTGGMHGNEDPGFQVVIYSLKAIVENYTYPCVNESFTNRIRNIINNTELYFIPMLNPDGVEANTRKNRCPNNCIFGKTLLRGIDLNKNFDYNWEDVRLHPFRYVVIPRSLDDLLYVIDSRTIHLFQRRTVIYPFLDWKSIFGDGRYCGPYAFSESENKAVKCFFENHNITICVDYHIFGEAIGYPKPWYYNTPFDKLNFISIAENISKINGYTIYNEEKLAWLNSSGDFASWSYIKYNVLSFLIELCDSMKPIYCPNKSEISILCNTHLLVNLYLAERVHTISN